MFVELNRDEWKDDIEGKERATSSSETKEKEDGMIRFSRSNPLTFVFYLKFQ